MDRTDAELDLDWQPSGRRPQSTIARSFSAELMDIFRIENSVADLDDKVDKRKQEVNAQTSELEALERRIREMEERLKRPAGQQAGAASTGSPSAQQSPVRNKSATAGQSAVQKDLPQRPSRPGTAKAQQQAAPVHGGAMPPTPTASEDGDHDS